jgi:poly(3-hydroxybutyrate) depolymerase
MRMLFRIFRAMLAVTLFSPWLHAQAQVPPGPGKWSSNQTWATDTYHGEQLTGYFYWPATQPALAGKRALVLVLHGCKQTAYGDVINNSDNGFNWKRVADQYGAVILAPNATGNVYFSHCWDFANVQHKRNTGHDGVLLDLVERFVNDPRFAIDPRQVYVTGLSSGGGETMVLGCMAPDVFAGVGINAGPSPGTTTFQIGYVPGSWTPARAGNKCKTLAGTRAPDFATQIASVVWGTNDFTVAPGYGPINAAALRIAYGGNFNQGASTIVTGGGSNIPYTDVNGKLRTSEMTVSGMGHAWPAGSGGQNTNFVDANRVDYPAFLMQFWFANNLRVSQAGAPVITSFGGTATPGHFLVGAGQPR